jgi:hypothetical protein
MHCLQVRKGVLPRLLQEILSTRLMVKQAMQKLCPSQQVLQRVNYSLILSQLPQCLSLTLTVLSMCSSSLVPLKMHKCTVVIVSLKNVSCKFVLVTRCLSQGHQNTAECLYAVLINHLETGMVM